MTERNDKDALYIMDQMTENFGEVGACIHLTHDLAMLPKLVTLHEKMGNLAAAEAYQEEVLLSIDDLVQDHAQRKDHLVEETQVLNRLYTSFCRRVEDLSVAETSNMATLARIAVFRRAALLGIGQLNKKMLENNEIGLPPFPVHIAAGLGAHRMVELLLHNSDLNPNAQDDDGMTAIQQAVKGCRKATLQSLLAADREAQKFPDIEETTLAPSEHNITVETPGNTIRQFKAKGRHTRDRMSLLLDATKNLDFDDASKGKFPLNTARNDFKMTVWLLLDKSASVHRSDERGETVLHYALSCPYGAVSRTWGYDSTSRDLKTEGAVPFLSRQSNETVVRLLIKAGIELNAINAAGETALHYAARCCNEQMLQTLLQAGAKVKVQDRKGETPLHHAAKIHDEKAVSQLIKSNADVTIKDYMGRTPLHLTVANVDGVQMVEDSEPLGRLLLDHGAAIQATDQHGNTPLHLAIKLRKPKLTWMLLKRQKEDDAKTNLMLQNSAGERPLNFLAAVTVREEDPDVRKWNQIKETVTRFVDMSALAI